ncbi:MAG: dihydrolipoamide succinyltransferase, partial [Halorhodospira halophila]
MSVEIKVPALPESVSEATVVAWHKQPGEAVSQDENLVDLETDKVVLEVPAPADGVLQGIDRAVGDTVTPDDILGHVEAGAAAATDDPPAAETAAAAAAGGQASDDAEPAPQGGE